MNRTRTILFVLLILGLFVGSSIGWYLYQKPHDDLHGLASEARLTAVELFAQFEADEQSAGKQYLNKVVQVEGQIAETTEVGPEDVVVFLRPADAMFGVSCAFKGPEAQKANATAIGSKVQIKGIVTGMNMDVNMVRCVFDE